MTWQLREKGYESLESDEKNLNSQHPQQRSQRIQDHQLEWNPLQLAQQYKLYNHLVIDTGMENPPGTRIRVLRVRVKIAILIPVTKPVPVSVKPVSVRAGLDS